MSTDTWKGKPRPVTEFPEPTKENTEDISKDDFEKLLKTAKEPTPIKLKTVAIPEIVLQQLKALDSEIESKMQLRQGLWTGCALTLGIDIVNNRASYNHSTGLITIEPAS